MAKKYGIIRVEKIKVSDGGGLHGRTAHDLREFKNDFDKELSALNEYGGETSVKGIKQVLKEKWDNLPSKPRKDAVGALEVVCTTSEKALTAEQEKKFFADCKKELESWYGKENLISWQIHRDETTPHLHAIICPIEEKTQKVKRISSDLISKIANGEIEHPTNTQKILNCRKITGGRESLRKMQNNFYSNVFKNYDLDRGEVGSTKKNVRSSLKLKSAELEEKEEYLVKIGKIVRKEQKTLENDKKTFEVAQKTFEDKQNTLEIQKANFKEHTKAFEADKSKYLAKAIKDGVDKIVEQRLAYVRQCEKVEKDKLQAKIDKYHKLIFDGPVNYNSEDGSAEITSKDGLLKLAQVAHNWRVFEPQKLRSIADEYEQYGVQNQYQLSEVKKNVQKKTNSRSSGGMGYS